MFYITGDTHRDFKRVNAFCETVNSTVADTLIILGDAGINYYGGAKDYWFKHDLSKLPITLFCIHGNHEQRPANVGEYEETLWNGGIVYAEPQFPNLLFAKDGEVYDIGGKKCVVIGGAYSIDRDLRIENNWDWWPDEQPSEAVKRRVEARLKAESWRVDVVLSHTVPLKYEPVETFMPGYDQSEVDKTTEIWLDSIEERLTYGRWFCGHYHINKTIDKVRFMFEDFLAFD